jgi:hypothetical protein
MKRIFQLSRNFCSGVKSEELTSTFQKLSKVPKRINLDYLQTGTLTKPAKQTKPASALSRILQSASEEIYFSKPSYNMAGELFTYLHENYGKLVKEFPVVKENISEIMPNLMALHVVLALERFNDERNNHARKELGAFFFYCQNYHFIPFARLCNDHLEPEDFAQFYIETYTNRVEMILSEFLNVEKEAQQQDRVRKIRKTLRSFIFMNLVQDKHPSLDKLAKYYLAHRFYLFSLRYEDILDHQIHWGLSGAPLQLEA